MATLLPRIRVLLLSDEMETGGTQRQIVHIAKNLDLSRFDPVVAYFRNRSFLADELERDGIPVYHIPKRWRIDIGFLFRLATFVRSGRFDIMHCFSFTGELWGTLARRFLGRRYRPALITSVRNTYDWYTEWQWRIKRWVSRQSCTVIANSQTGAEYARKKMGLAPDVIQVVYNGVAPAGGELREAERSDMRRQFGAPPARVLGAFVGRLVVQKNLPVLLRAVHRLGPVAQDFHLLIAGDGPLREQVEEMIRTLDLSQIVQLLGHRADAERIMRAGDFLVLPSLREGLSNVILEAMMAGKAVIASKVGGNGELVQEGRTGLLFDNDDDIELAKCLHTLIVNESLRQRLGALGRACALADFGVPAMVRAMAEHYTQAITERVPVTPG